jgi:hypothetical protein
MTAFLRAGILTETELNRETITGTPQGGILSPLLASIALSVVDEHFAAKWEALGPAWTRIKRRRAGHPVMKLVRYADDFVIMVGGTRDDADASWDEVGAVLAPMGLRLSIGKSRVCHIEEGFDFLGWHIQRRAWRSRSGKKAVFSYPSKKTLASMIDKVRALTCRAKHRTLADYIDHWPAQRMLEHPAQRSERLAQGLDLGDPDPEAGRAHPFDVASPVFLPVGECEVGPQGDDAGNVRVLGAAHASHVEAVRVGAPVGGADQRVGSAQRDRFGERGHQRCHSPGGGGGRSGWPRSSVTVTTRASPDATS